MAKRDCFAYTSKDKHEGCMALNDLYCKKEECRFYKNKKDINMEQIELDIHKYNTYKK